MDSRKGNQMDTQELNVNLGKPASIAVNGMIVDVTIKAAKHVYGTMRYLITPVSGTGSQWVNADRVTIQKEEVQS